VKKPVLLNTGLYQAAVVSKHSNASSEVAGALSEKKILILIRENLNNLVANLSRYCRFLNQCLVNMQSLLFV
jgi:hypothetical protein